MSFWDDLSNEGQLFNDADSGVAVGTRLINGEWVAPELRRRGGQWFIPGYAPDEFRAVSTYEPFVDDAVKSGAIVRDDSGAWYQSTTLQDMFSDAAGITARNAGGFFGETGPWQAFSQTIGRALAFTGIASLATSLYNGTSLLGSTFTQAAAPVVEGVPTWLAPGEVFNGLTAADLAAGIETVAQSFPYQAVIHPEGVPIDLAPAAPGGNWSVPNVTPDIPSSMIQAPTIASPAALAPAALTAASSVGPVAAFTGALGGLAAAVRSIVGTGASSGASPVPGGAVPGTASNFFDLGGARAPGITAAAAAPVGALSQSMLALVVLGGVAVVAYSLKGGTGGKRK